MKRVIHDPLVVRLRAYFGLTQAQLALYLGVSPALAQHLESGQRRLTPAILAALLPLLQQLPEPATLADEAASPAAPLASPPPGLPPPDRAELDFRRRECLVRATQAEAELATLAHRALVAQRWAQALPVLLAAAAASTATELAAAGTDTQAVAAVQDRAAWLTGWLHRRAQPLPTELATRWHLLRARAAALAAEAAALAEGPGSESASSPA